MRNPRVTFLIATGAYAGNSDDTVRHSFLSAHADPASVGVNATFAIPTYHASPDSGFSLEHFERIVRRGIPSVFEGVADDWEALRGMSCEDYAKRWPNAMMRAEYTGLSEAETFLKLGDAAWVNSTRAPAGMNHPSEDCDDETAKNSRPAVSPYVWHVKDRVKATIKQEIASMFMGLPWARTGASPALDAHTRDTMEFWFQRVGAGTFAHNDGYCHSVFSVQLRGEKKWRLMLTPAVEKLARDVFDEFDSGIYKSVHKWEPDFEVVVKAGDGILFPPGYMHETRTVAGPSESDQCATSVTFNVPLPLPVSLVRKFLPRFSVSREIHHCMRRWESFVTASSVPITWEKPVPENEQISKVTEALFESIDTNKDKLMTVDEILQHIKKPEQKFGIRRGAGDFGDFFFSFSPNKRMTHEQLDEIFTVRARDTLAMWDVNDDGLATYDEVRDVIEYFQFYSWRREMVETAVTVKNKENGEEIKLPIGSDIFSKRLSIVDFFMEKVRPNPPTLDKSKYPRIARENREDEL